MKTGRYTDRLVDPQTSPVLALQRIPAVRIHGSISYFQPSSEPILMYSLDQTLLGVFSTINNLAMLRYLIYLSGEYCYHPHTLFH
jgi:hypothetical protein